MLEKYNENAFNFGVLIVAHVAINNTSRLPRSFALRHPGSLFHRSCVTHLRTVAFLRLSARTGRRTCAATADARGGGGPRWRKPARHRRQERAQQVAHVVKCGATAQLPRGRQCALPRNAAHESFWALATRHSGTGSWAATRTAPICTDGEFIDRISHAHAI